MLSTDTFLKFLIKNTIGASNYLDPDQADILSGLFWTQNVCKGYQQVTSGATSKSQKSTCPLLFTTTSGWWASNFLITY